MSLADQIDPLKLPKHIAVIMDGNGRWAKQKGKNRVFGHRNGVDSVRQISEGCAEIGVDYLTLYAFSTENWNRPRLEISALMELLIHTIRKETKTLQENDIRLKAIGDLSALPDRCRKELEASMEETASNKRMDLILALSYSGKSEILRAVQLIGDKIKSGLIQPSDVNERILAEHLYTHDVPDPELLIRTSGEVRISNFLLWQLAYTELYFTEKFWPDFKKDDLFEAILDYQRRERRFGKTGDQVKA